MQNTLRLQVSRPSLFRRRKQAEMPRFTIHMDSGNPLGFSGAPCRAKNAGHAAFPGAAPVLHVLAMVSVSEVAPSVIAADPIDVVNFSIRPIASHDQKCEPVNEIALLKNACNQMAGRAICAPSYLPSPNIASIDLPSKDSGVRVVAKQLSNSFGEGVISHGSE